MRTLIKHVRIEPFREGPDFELKIFDTGTYDRRGQTKLAYELVRLDAPPIGDKVLFAGGDFCGSPMYADNSDSTARSLLGFLTLKPGDTDADYFNEYSPEQLAWCQSSECEALGMYASEEDELSPDFINLLD